MTASKPTDIDEEVESTADLQPKSSYRTKAKVTGCEDCGDLAKPYGNPLRMFCLYHANKRGLFV